MEDLHLCLQKKRLLLFFNPFIYSFNSKFNPDKINLAYKQELIFSCDIMAILKTECTFFMKYKQMHKSFEKT